MEYSFQTFQGIASVKQTSTEFEITILRDSTDFIFSHVNLSDSESPMNNGVYLGIQKDCNEMVAAIIGYEHSRKLRQGQVFKVKVKLANYTLN